MKKRKISCPTYTFLQSGCTIFRQKPSFLMISYQKQKNRNVLITLKTRLNFSGYRPMILRAKSFENAILSETAINKIL